MKRSGLWIAVVVGVILGVTYSLAGAYSLADISFAERKPPAITCQTLNNGNNNYNLLVVGDSWAYGGAFFPELQKELSTRMNGRGVRACSIGYPRRNSRRLISELRLDFPPERITPLFDGRAPDKVIVPTGVNDVLMPIGADNYAKYTDQIVTWFSAQGSAVEVVAVPRIEEGKFANPLSHLKHAVLNCLYDNCMDHVIDHYRGVLKAFHPEISVIDYDKFIPDFAGNEQKYMDDGHHLTPAAMHEYGAFLGREISVPR
jgi:hypothetical protein